MQPSFAPIQYEDIPAAAAQNGGVIYRISYGVRYGGMASPHFAYKVEAIDHEGAADQVGLYLLDDDGAPNIITALSGFILKPHPL